MSVVSAVHRVLVGALIGLAGEDSRARARGDGDGDRSFMRECENCASIVYRGPKRQPARIERDCRCGHVTTGNWRETTKLLIGRPCPTCGRILFDRGSPPPRRECNGARGHQPPPVHDRD